MKPEWQRRIARERIEILFKLAEQEFPEHKDRSNRYVELARKIGMKYKVRIPRELKRKFCRKCYAYIKPGVNCKVTIDSQKKYVEYKCEECGHVKRYIYSQKSQKYREAKKQERKSKKKAYKAKRKVKSSKKKR
jgi:ribonuclease P protein subunit RPR2